MRPTVQTTHPARLPPRSTAAVTCAMQLRLGGATSSESISGSAVAVLLDVDDATHTPVIVDGHGAGNDEETLVKAIDHLSRTLAQLRRLYGSGI